MPPHLPTPKPTRFPHTGTVLFGRHRTRTGHLLPWYRMAGTPGSPSGGLLQGRMVGGDISSVRAKGRPTQQYPPWLLCGHLCLRATTLQWDLENGAPRTVCHLWGSDGHLVGSVMTLARLMAPVLLPPPGEHGEVEKGLPCGAWALVSAAEQGWPALPTNRVGISAPHYRPASPRAPGAPVGWTARPGGPSCWGTASGWHLSLAAGPAA